MKNGPRNGRGYVAICYLIVERVAAFTIINAVNTDVQASAVSEIIKFRAFLREIRMCDYVYGVDHPAYYIFSRARTADGHLICLLARARAFGAKRSGIRLNG